VIIVILPMRTILARDEYTLKEYYDVRKSQLDQCTKPHLHLAVEVDCSDEYVCQQAEQR